MEKTFEIELQEVKNEEQAEMPLPVNFLTFGEIENDDVKVYIKQDVYKELEKLSVSDTTKELGSILLGDYCVSCGKTQVILSQFVEAKYTDASASTLTFTHETWDYVHSEHAKRCPEKKILGWQHTHPGYGIFLSNYDMFIQENFFNLPFQVAYVIDPIQNIRGFFQWKNGKVEKLKGYYIYDHIGKPIKIQQLKEKKEKKESKSHSKSVPVLLALLCLMTVVLSGVVLSLYKQNRDQLAVQETILEELELQGKELEAQRELLLSQSETIGQLQAQIDHSKENGEDITGEEAIAMLERHELLLQNQGEALEELKDYEEAEKASGQEVRLLIYTVTEGDSLYDICVKNGLDYGSNIQRLMTLNGITNPDHLFVGQTLLLPIPKE